MDAVAAAQTIQRSVRGQGLGSSLAPSRLLYDQVCDDVDSEGSNEEEESGGEKQVEFIRTGDLAEGGNDQRGNGSAFGFNDLVPVDVVDQLQDEKDRLLDHMDL